MTKRTLFITAMALSLVSACGPKEYKSIGNADIKVFESEHLYFSPGSFNDAIDEANGQTYRLVDGRILMKKVKLPVYEREATASIRVTVASAGDRWDKSGSCFVVPANSPVNFVSIHNGASELPEPLENHEALKGIASTGGYTPVVELMRFMTPFGVGFYNDKMDLRKPVYIPKWEEKVMWEQDVTDLLSLLEGEVWIGIWIDTWTAEGYTVSVDLSFKESIHPCAAKKRTHVLPLVNTVYYAGGQTHPDIFSRKDLTIDVQVPQNAKNVRLKYITTGHGGHSGGDEFVQKRNIVKMDNTEILNFVPWRDDCASFRRFNPGSGLWIRKDTTEYINHKSGKYEQKEIEERIASSDLSRSNWCPGSDVLPQSVLLDKAGGAHRFAFSIPEAQQAEGDKLNHWLISSYLVWEE